MRRPCVQIAFLVLLPVLLGADRETTTVFGDGLLCKCPPADGIEDVPSFEQGECAEGEAEYLGLCFQRPRLIRKVPPRYPLMARLGTGKEGCVSLRAVINSDGTIGEVLVTDSVPPHRKLERAARKAVRKWRWEPATLDGAPVPSMMCAHVMFELER